MQFREMTVKDLPFFLEIRNECREFLHNNSEFTLEQALDWYTKSAVQQEYFIISYQNTDIGYFRVRATSPVTLQIGADLHKDYRGLGLAFLAYTEFIKTVTCYELELEVLATNYRAYNLYKKLGFQSCEVKDILRDGKWVASIKMIKELKS